MKVCFRLGDGDDYHVVDSLYEAVEALAYYDAGRVVSFVDGGMGYGIQTEAYNGHNFISLFWGDDNAQFDHALTQGDRRLVVSWLREMTEAG